MKIYTQEDVNSFDRDESGRLVFPMGDYSQIRRFGERCSFDAYCRFGERCRFGEGCRFGEWCCFEEGCSFGAWCSFGERCSICEGCNFGAVCSFGDECSFGECCSFGAKCSFGERCDFDADCSFEDGRVKNGEYFACDRIGSKRRKIYFFRDGDGEMYVRARYWFSSLDAFVERVKEAHGGTKYKKEYLAAVELAKIVLEVKQESEV